MLSLFRFRACAFTACMHAYAFILSWSHLIQLQLWYYFMILNVYTVHFFPQEQIVGPKIQRVNKVIITRWLKWGSWRTCHTAGPLLQWNWPYSAGICACYFLHAPFELNIHQSTSICTIKRVFVCFFGTTSRHVRSKFSQSCEKNLRMWLSDLLCFAT